ncbi:MAG: 50S ribosomal protein L11 methyltransferase, partial [Myxococcota bacterium]
MEPRYPYVHVQTTADEAEALSDRLWALGAQGIEERDGTTMESALGVLLIASFPDEESAEA